MTPSETLFPGSPVIQEPARSVPVVWQGDLCVVGGSCTGVFAAVRAARLGLSVALVEQTGLLGGSAVAAQVNEWHSLHDVLEQEQIIGGLTVEMLDRLRLRGALRELAPLQRGRFRFNSAELALELDDLLREHRVRLFLCARLASAVREQDRVTAAVVEDKSGRRALCAATYVDASGDGDLLRAAGFGAWRPTDLQPVNLQALVVGFAALRERYPGVDFWGSIAPLAHSHGLPDSNASPWLFDYPGGQDVTNVFGPRLNGIDASDADQLTAALTDGRRHQRAYVEMARAAFPDAPLHIVAWPHALGVRETWHAECLHRLTGAELLSGTSFPDAIARGTYPVDIHGPDGTVLRYLDGTEEFVDPCGQRIVRRWRSEGSAVPRFYRIPYRSLVPREAKNLLVAGRLLDADRQAFGGVRVMVNCNQMGEAAGVASALAVRENRSVTEVDPGALRAELVSGGSAAL